MPLFSNQLQGEHIAYMESSTDSDIIYEICVGKDNVVYCTCPGWVHSRKSPKCCRHMKSFAEDHTVLMVKLLMDRGYNGDDAGVLVQSFLKYNGKRI